MTNAMLNALAPYASAPPSPKNNAWINNAMLMAITAAHGPNTIASNTAPTAWAVVPSGIGTLNIITRNAYAAPRARSGTNRLFTIFFTRRLAVSQTGTIAVPNVAQVSGLR